MIEYENNNTTNDNNFENNIAPSIATLTINFNISFSHERNPIIEKYFVSFTEYMKAMALITFPLNFSF